MITKILFTAAVIGLVFLLARARTRAQSKSGDSALEHTPSQAKRSLFPRIAASAVIGVMILASALFLYREWEDRYRIVNVRVINSDTGYATTYQAYKGDIEGRRFQALDGRVVTLAEVERMELGGSNQ